MKAKALRGVRSLRRALPVPGSGHDNPVPEQLVSAAHLPIAGFTVSSEQAARRNIF